jgi:ABC-type dipeptide/oligopeptide/nickel transport system ATPase component
MNQSVLQINDLSISFGMQHAVENVSFTIERGETLSIVGESGSGKSVTAMAILGLLPPTARVSGEIFFEGSNLLSATPKQIRSVRGDKIAMIFQEPMSSLNPVFTIGEQIEEAVFIHRNERKKVAKSMAIEVMEEVGLDGERFSAYPHEFSGGMRQRVMIAMALVCEPVLLIADEPTTALDATTSRQIMELLLEIKETRGMSMLFISHNLHLVTSIADTVCVMQQGGIVEQGTAASVLKQPSHQYTRELIDCIPSLSVVR